jgi:hypothetical protein
MRTLNLCPSACATLARDLSIDISPKQYDEAGEAM